MLEAVSTKERVKTSKDRRPSLATIMNLTSAKTDTTGSAIKVTETKRVIRMFIDQVVDDYSNPVDRMHFLMKNFF